MKKKETVRVSVSIPAEMYAELQRMAEENDRSVSGQVVWMLRPAMLVQEHYRVSNAACDLAVEMSKDGV